MIRGRLSSSAAAAPAPPRVLLTLSLSVAFYQGKPVTKFRAILYAQVVPSRQSAWLYRRTGPALMTSGDGFVTTIPVGVASSDANGYFTVALPDFSQDELASAPDHPGV